MRRARVAPSWAEDTGPSVGSKQGSKKQDEPENFCALLVRPRLRRRCQRRVPCSAARWRCDAQRFRLPPTRELVCWQRGALACVRRAPALTRRQPPQGASGAPKRARERDQAVRTEGGPALRCFCCFRLRRMPAGTATAAAKGLQAPTAPAAPPQPAQAAADPPRRARRAPQGLGGRVGAATVSFPRSATNLSSGRPCALAPPRLGACAACARSDAPPWRRPDVRGSGWCLDRA